MSELVGKQLKHSRGRWLFSSHPFYSKIGTLLAEQTKSSAPPPPPNTKQYYVYIDDRRHGPYRKSRLINMIADDTVGVGEETYIWREGMDDWREAREVKEIASAFRDSGTPPPPPKTPRG
jgi:hypothetical protein